MIHQFQDGEIGRACHTHAKEEESTQQSDGKSRMKDMTTRTLHTVDNITMDLRGMGWIHLAHDRDEWLAVVKIVISCEDDKERKI
jgi:hypothetical protein